MSGTVECHLADARVLPLADASVDAVITSPPYINVFNYHQNYRSAAELLGWSPLEGARSEIGANRKHRSNRFLTVIQYSLDMAQSLAELSRVMQPGTPLVIVLGRTSNVLGAAFENGAMVIDLLERSGSFEIVRRAERCFTNRYGDQIYEDILIARCIRHEVAQLEAARNIGIAALLNNIGTVCNKNRAALESAIARAPQVRPSPMLTISVPPPFIEHSSSTAIAHAGN